MATTADIKNGLCIELNGKLFSVVQFLHVKPGKGAAFVRTKLKNLENGKVIEHTFNSGVKLNTIRVERRPYQFLYKEEDHFVVMHNETFEQMNIPEHMIENADLMKEGELLEVMYHTEADTPLTVELPPFVEMEVTYTEPGLKGDTASSTALKQATLETGAIVKVPLFINTGDRIKVDTRERSYSERVKG